MMPAIRLLAVVVVLLAATLTVNAQPPSDESVARLHFERGKQLVNAKDFAHAYDEFAAGYELTHRAPFLFNMGECERALGDAARARELYVRYLTTSPDGDLAGAARARLSDLGGVPPPRAPAETAPIVVIPSPKIVAEQQPPAAPPIAIERRPAPLWHRTSFWIVVGAALVGGSVAVYAATRHEDRCTPPTCVMIP
jgi:tetratricopeptide (TPR) repeat protein